MTTRMIQLLSSLALVISVLPACSDDTKATDGPRLLADQGPASEQRAADSRRDHLVVDSAPAATVCGTLVDSAGAPVADGDVIICIGTEICRSTNADDKGAFCVGADLAGDYLFHAPEKTVGGKHYADVLFPLPVTESDISSRVRIELGTITEPLITRTAALDVAAGGTLDLGSGAKLTVPANSALCPALKTCSGVGLAEVPVAKLHPNLLASRGGTLPTVCTTTGVPQCPVLAYVLTIYDVIFSPAATFETPTLFSASPVTLDAYHASSKTGKLEPAGQVTVTNGTLSAPLPALGWWVFYQP